MALAQFSKLRLPRLTSNFEADFRKMIKTSGDLFFGLFF